MSPKRSQNLAITPIGRWVLIWILHLMLLGFGANNYTHVLLLTTLIAPLTVGAIEWLRAIAIPRYLLHGSIRKFIQYTLLVLMVTITLILAVLLIGIGFIPELTADNLPGASSNYAFFITTLLLIIGAFGFFFYWKQQQTLAIEKNKLEAELLQSQLSQKAQELDYLQQQINPHFLFNTLNTLYAAALRQAKETPDMILKLSELLDYAIYQSPKKWVPLTEEWRHVQNYIQLEQLRYKDTLVVTQQESIEDKAFSLPPLIILPFIENAFKHGSFINGTLSVDIEITVSKGKLNFRVTNSFEKTDNKPGLGLENVKRRLELLYSGMHKLQAQEVEDLFKVELIINTKVNK